MDLKTIPYNMTFKFGEDLREIPLDKNSMEEGVEFLKSLMTSETNESSIADIKSTLGVYLRILGNLDESQFLLNQALENYQAQKDETNILTTQIRLAHTLQWRKCFKEANTLLEQALNTSINHPRYRGHQDFVLQHLGKLRFDQGLYQDARELFQKALFLRNKKGVPELIQSSEYSLRITEKLTL